jgi:NTP pyrophosphatase (non-canonical NTP hydrolase)
VYDQKAGIAIQDLRELISRQPYLSEMKNPQQQLIALLGLVEEANEVATEILNNLDIFATDTTGNKVAEELQSTIEVSLSIGKELGTYKKRLLKEDLHIDVQSKNNPWYEVTRVSEECFDVLYYWLLILSSNDINLLTLLELGINKVKRKDPNVR